jgi:argininosuccinate lyase
MKLWQKDQNISSDQVDAFTVGNDRSFDALMASHDVLGNMAHANMLESIGLLSASENEALQQALRKMFPSLQEKGFVLPADVEDIHSYIENKLTEELGEVGKKIHAARSRNDQVLVDIRLFLRDEIEFLVKHMVDCFQLLQKLSQQHQYHLLPGYTHLQLAMPSSFGLWLGAYAESLADDVLVLQNAYRITNKNPLGSAAGYGSSFPINRTMTTELLGFDTLNYNVVYAQMGRGKVERITAQAITSVAETLAKMSMDMCLYMSQNMGFVSFPDNLTTGSSIMPHKKNPDVFELIRGKCNRIKSIPQEIMLLTTNLPSGYHRDLQLLKEALFPAFEELHHCLNMMMLMLSNMQVQTNILDDPRYTYLFTVDAVNNLVMQGMPFRDAYREVGRQVNEGSFQKPTQPQLGTHEGSMGNLCNEEIASLMKTYLEGFGFEQKQQAIAHLLKN